MRNALDLDSADNAAIRAEIGERLRVLLSKEQPRPPPRSAFARLLECVGRSVGPPQSKGWTRDATGVP
jgi:hypothetical protein